jgi:hypothetical protein
VADGNLPVDGLLSQQPSQVAQFSFLAADGDSSTSKSGDSSRVIAAIFKPLEAIKHNIRGLTRANVTNDAAHGIPPGLTPGESAPKNQSPALLKGIAPGSDNAKKTVETTTGSLASSTLTDLHGNFLRGF